MSEAASFALAAHMPRAEAQTLVKDALKLVNGQGKTLTEALTEIGPDGIDWVQILDPRQAIAPSQAQAKAIFANRTNSLEETK